MGRAPCCEKVGLKKGRWTAEEDEILTKYIQTNGEGSWRSLPTKAGLLRCGKSCRLRWINYLRGDLKRGNIVPDEEEVIIKLHSSYGNRWSLIAGHLPGRTDNEIKNYWNSHLSRRIHTIRRLNQDGVPVVLDIGKFVGGPKQRRGRTRRSTLKSNINNLRREKIQEAASTKLNPDQQRQKIGSIPNQDNNVIVLSDKKDSGLSGLSHEDLDDEFFCSDVMDASAFWGSNEPTDTHNLSPPQGHNLVRREERQAGASNLSCDVFDNGVFSANEVSDSRFLSSSNKEREDDIFTFCHGNDMVPGEKETGMSGFSYENLSDILYPNQVNESGFWGSDDENGSHLFTSPHSDGAILDEARDNNIPSLSYGLLENEFFRLNEVADSVFWSSHEGTEGDLNTGLESGFLSSSDVMGSGTMPPENEQEPCEEVENGRSSFTHPNQGKQSMTSMLKNADDKRNNEWCSSGLMTGGLDWIWEGFEDDLREMEGGEMWSWIQENDNGEGGLGFDDELSTSSAAWLFC